MVKFGRILLKEGINKKILEILVCPLSKQPLRLCEKTSSLISDAIGVSYPCEGHICSSFWMAGAPMSQKYDGGYLHTIYDSSEIVDGIPRLVPTDGKIIETDDASHSDGPVDLPGK